LRRLDRSEKMGARTVRMIKVLRVGVKSTIKPRKHGY
jgi:hypothetical protein